MNSLSTIKKRNFTYQNLLCELKQEADSFKISANMPYIMLQKIWNVLVKSYGEIT